MKGKTQTLAGPMLARAAQIDSGGIIDEDERIVELSFSSEEPYTRASFFNDPWVEILGHKKTEADLTRLNQSAPFLFNHSSHGATDHIGVVEKAWIKNGRGMARVRMTTAPDADPIWHRIKEGTLRNISVGYQINQRSLVREHDDGPDEYRVTRWTPMEISAVPLPADATVGIGRNADNIFVITDDEEESMSSENVEDLAVNEDGKDVIRTAEVVEDTETVKPKTRRKAKAVTAEPEVVRVGRDTEEVVAILRACADAGVPEHAELYLKQDLSLTQIQDELGKNKTIRELCVAANLAERADGYIDDGKTVDQVRASLFEHLTQKQDETPVSAVANVQIIEDQSDKFREGATKALLARAGYQKDEGENNFRGHTLLMMAQKSLEMNGINTAQMGKLEMAGHAFTMRSATHSTSDFDNVLADVATKTMLVGYENQPESFEQWTRKGTLPDFKGAKRVGMNVMPSLRQVRAGAEYNYVTVGDRGETIQLLTYGELFTIDRQTIINDDLDAFSRIPQMFGRAAKRTVGDLVYAVLTDNAALADGTALFHANHNNLVASGTAISTTSVDALAADMAKQKDPNSQPANGLNIEMAYLIVPRALKGTALTVRNSDKEITASGKANTTPNSVMNTFDVIADARLDADSSTAWYGAGSANSTDTIEVAYLDGNDSPFLEQQDGWNIDGTSFKVRIDAGAKALDYVALAKNPGA